MRVLLLPLLWLPLLCGEALSSDTFLNSRPASRPIVYVLPGSRFHERGMAPPQVMLNRDIAGQSMPAVGFRGQRPTTPTNVGSPRIIQGTPFATIPSVSHFRQGSHMDDDPSRFSETKRPSNFDLDRRLGGSNQVHTPPSIGPNQSPSLITQNPKISSFNFVPKTTTFNQDHRLSGFDEAPKTSTFKETPKLSSFAGQNPSLVFSQTTKPSIFAGGQNPSSVFNQTPKPSIFAGQTPSSVFNQTPKPSSFDQDDKPSTFDHIPKTPLGFIPVQKPSSFDTNLDTSVTPFLPKPSTPEKGQKPFSSEEDRKPSSFDQDHKPVFPPQVPQPRRNPVCNIRPDPGTCRAALPRYYYDPETGTCNCFLYGGCREGGQGESPSSFHTLRECLQECRPPRHEEGPGCKEIFKEEQFISYLAVDTPIPPQSKGVVDLSHLSNKEFVASFTK